MGKRIPDRIAFDLALRIATSDVPVEQTVKRLVVVGHAPLDACQQVCDELTAWDANTAEQLRERLIAAIICRDFKATILPDE